MILKSMATNENGTDIREELLRVLDIEIEALRTVRSSIGPEFSQAVEQIAACTGQVFVSGVGKSGIIARKVAATFRSTGTPSMFLHAAEALHGDIGMVRANDLLLVIGKSGESEELNALLRVVKKIGVPVIAITSSPSSAMASLSDLVLHLRITQEACPLNLAPTASTTAALAVGDALAVALMKIKNISAEDFARHHPGGQIGKRLLLKAEDLMRKGDQNPQIPLETRFDEVLIQVTRFQVGAVSVVDTDRRLLGLITDYDIRRSLQAGSDVFTLTAASIMNPAPDFALRDEAAAAVLDRMQRRPKPISVMPVLNADRTVAGMIHVHDLISAGL